MLSYQHAYHAGNHADILKHYVLLFTLNSLNKKEKPYTCIDTHAGSGLYDLLDNRSQKTREAEKGILQLLGKKTDKLQEIESFNNYIELVSKYTSKKMYPGSPEIEKNLLRQQDYLILSELHPQEFINLQNNMSEIKTENRCNIQINNKDGFNVLNASTPPVTKRGMIIIDPSYEETEDYENVTRAIINVYKKWSNGIILLWYPLLSHRSNEIQIMKERIEQAVLIKNKNTEIVDLQLCVNDSNAHKELSLKENQMDKKNPPRLYGSGMYVINAPWHLKEEGESVVKILQSILYS